MKEDNLEVFKKLIALGVDFGPYYVRSGQINKRYYLS